MPGKSSYLIEILLPKVTGGGLAVEQEWFEGLLKELTDRFGGVTSFIRAPGEGLWVSGDKVESDTIAVVEVMTDELEEDFWERLRARLEEELIQDEVVIRAQTIRRF